MRLKAHPDKKHILITAGPTREKIDPVRFISNYSTGTFGYEIAKEARKRGFFVTLVSGPTVLKVPAGVRFIKAESAMEMKKAVEREFTRADCLIMAAAVSDWRVWSTKSRKIKRGQDRGKVLRLVENPDIIKEIGRRKDGKILVGFALETEGLLKNACKKLKEKNLDLVIANRLSSKSGIFGDKKIGISIIDRFGKIKRVANKSKRELAKIILDKVEAFNI